ncbi:MAG: DUF3881 family protein [Lachnospiraceae bacterium]|nr:DUF3881 family protein [Lachnospiraceae bacterium]
MHKYLRAIGFSNLIKTKQYNDFLRDIVKNSDERSYTITEDEVVLGEFSKNLSFDKNLDFGITVSGEFDEDDKFMLNYSYPYLAGKGITSFEDVTIERHAAKDSYAGICDDERLGISVIFYLRNMIQYVSAKTADKLPMRGTSLTLSALSVSGNILLPVKKDEEQRQQIAREQAGKRQLIAEAKKGNEDAMETLTLEEMDTYNVISRRIRHEDVYSVVDTFFMPYGVECDLYTVMGEIMEVKKTTNTITNEEIYILTICCNELTFDVCINIIDLFGEPKPGRRFKGVIWIQGYINFPDYK